jgi:hypothetical protein
MVLGWKSTGATASTSYSGSALLADAGDHTVTCGVSLYTKAVTQYGSKLSTVITIVTQPEPSTTLCVGHKFKYSSK